MRYKIIVGALFLCIVSNVQGQIGINTTKPRKEVALDVNGDLQLRGELKIGETADPGEDGQILVSQGEGMPPTWKSIELGDLIGEYRLAKSLYGLDETGVSFDQDPVTPISIKENIPLTNDWKVIDGLKTTFKIEKANSVALVRLQTTAQSSYYMMNTNNDDVDADPLRSEGNWLNFAGAIFIKKGTEAHKLKIARQDRIINAIYPQVPYSMFYQLENLEPGNYELDVAFYRLDSSDLLKAHSLFIGASSDLIKISNSFMNHSYLQIDIYEPRK